MTLEGASACSSVFVNDAKSLVWSVSMSRYDWYVSTYLKNIDMLRAMKKELSIKKKKWPAPGRRLTMK